jgi:hypothetical protein
MTLLAVRGLEKTDAEFRARLIRLGAELEVDPNWIAAVISFESAGTFAPNVTFGGGRYRGPQDDGKAVGLIQFTNVALDTMRRHQCPTTKAALAAMTATQQLEWVKRYFLIVLGTRRMASLSDVYMAVFAPIAVGKDDSQVLYLSPTPSYTANRALDRNGDGTITRGEACVQVKAILAEAERRGPLPPAAGGEGDALEAFPDSGRSSVDDLTSIRQSVADARAEICARLDTVNASLRDLAARLGG